MTNKELINNTVLCTREKKITTCRKCNNRIKNSQILICSLTNEKTKFNGECPNFQIDETVEPKNQISKKVERSKKIEDNQLGSIGSIGSIFSSLSLLIVLYTGYKSIYDKEWFFTDSSGLTVVFLIIMGGIGFVLSFIGLFKKPRGLAIFGLLIPLILLILFVITY